MADPTTYRIDRPGVVTITMDAPERRNSFGQPMLKSLLAHLSQAVESNDVRVIVLTNVGTVFSAGADLKEDRSTIGPGDPTFFDLVTAIDESPKPVVGRIAGHAAGGGAAVAIACDLSVMVDSARIGITEVRLGIAPVAVAAMLAHRLSPRAMFESFLAADMMPAVRAQELGLVNLAVAEAELDTTVDRFVDTLIRGGPDSLAMTKKALRAMTGRTAEENAVVAQHLTAELTHTEAQAGVAAFVNKQDAPWVPTPPGRTGS